MIESYSLGGFYRVGDYMLLFERITLHNLDKQIRRIELKEKRAGLIVKRRADGYQMFLSVHDGTDDNGRFNELESEMILDAGEPLIFLQPSKVMEFADANGIARHRIRFVK